MSKVSAKQRSEQLKLWLEHKDKPTTSRNKQSKPAYNGREKRFHSKA